MHHPCSRSAIVTRTEAWVTSRPGDRSSPRPRSRGAQVRVTTDRGTTPRATLRFRRPESSTLESQRDGVLRVCGANTRATTARSCFMTHALWESPCSSNRPPAPTALAAARACRPAADKNRPSKMSSHDIRPRRDAPQLEGFSRGRSLVAAIHLLKVLAQRLTSGVSVADASPGGRARRAERYWPTCVRPAGGIRTRPKWELDEGDHP
jgi:hypothetical protein